MNTFKRYLTLAATAIICTASLTLGAMKRKNNQKTSHDEIEIKKSKITPQKKIENEIKTGKIPGLLGEKCYEVIEHFKTIKTTLLEAYKQEKKSLSLSGNNQITLHQLLKKYAIPEKIFLNQLQNYFDDKAIALFTSWCETTKNSEKNDKIFENVINYALEHENDGDFSIFQEIKEFCITQNIEYPTIEDFNTRCTEKNPQQRLHAWLCYKKEHAISHPSLTIDTFPHFKKLIDTSAKECGIQLKNVVINKCTATEIDTEKATLFFDINEILYCHYTHEEIQAIIYHELTHLKNNDTPIIISIIEPFLSSCDTNNPHNFIQKNTDSVSQFFGKIKELYADNGVFAKKSALGHLTSIAKSFIVLTKISPTSDPCAFYEYVTTSKYHLPQKQRIVWGIRLNNLYPWGNSNKTQDTQTYTYFGTTNLPIKQEYIPFALAKLKNDFEDIIKKGDNNALKKILQSFTDTDLCIMNFQDPQKILGIPFQQAKQKEQRLVVQEFFKPEFRNILLKINKEDLGALFKYAAKYGFYEFFKNYDLLKKISSNDLGWILIYASQNKHLNVFLELYTPKNVDLLKKIDPNDLACACMKASPQSEINAILRKISGYHRDTYGFWHKDTVLGA